MAGEWAPCRNAEGVNDSMSVSHASVLSPQLTPVQEQPTAMANQAAGRIALVEGIGAGAVARIAWQRIARQRAVLVAIDRPPARINRLQAMVLSWAQGVLAPPPVAPVLRRHGIAASRVVTPGQLTDCAAFTACPVTRAGPDATRIAYVGELSPHSGVADFLSCATLWADRHPDRSIEICWAGGGDLQGVLQAQWLPPNLQQAFVDAQDTRARAAVFARCGLLVAPNPALPGSLVVAEAMAAGLLVLGSARSAAVRGLVQPNVTGWLFDPLVPDQMMQALDAALSTGPARLNEMRAAARARVSPGPERLAGGLHRNPALA